MNKLEIKAVLMERMSKSVSRLIEDLEIKLKDASQAVTYHRLKTREFEGQVMRLENSIEELTRIKNNEAANKA